MSSDTHAIVFSTVSRLAGNFASVKTRPHALSREKNRDKEISRSVGIFWWDVRLVISYSIIQCWGVIVNNLEANKSVINTALAARPPARIYAITRYIVALTSKDSCAARFTLNNHSIHCFMREHSLLPLQWPRSPKKSAITFRIFELEAHNLKHEISDPPGAHAAAGLRAATASKLHAGVFELWV